MIAVARLSTSWSRFGSSSIAETSPAASIAEALAPRWVVPMHYRTDRIGFLETEEDFASRMPQVERLTGNAFETSELPQAEGILAVIPAAP